MRLIQHLCERLAARLPRRVIGNARGEPYLAKHRLRDGRRTSWSLYLHEFHRSDEDANPHDHPYAWSVSLILSGGYVEHRYVPYLHGPARKTTRVLRPGAINWIKKDTFHRVDLLDGRCWSLFLTGPVTGSWGFLDVATNTWTEWREYLARKGFPPSPEGHVYE